MKLFKDASYLKINTHATCIEQHNQGPIACENFDVIVRAGISVGLHSSWSSELTWDTQAMSVASIRDNIGEWSALAQRKTATGSEYLAFTDQSGFGSLFFSVVPGRFVILSDSFQGVIRGLDEHRITRELDVDNYLSMLHLPEVDFRTHFSSRTMAEEVRIVPPGVLMYLSSRSVALLQRNVLGGASDVSNYDEALRHSLSYTTGLLHRIPSLLPGGAYTHLSGGVDSRLILAMISSNGLQPEYPVYSGDPRGVANKASRDVILNDVRIANMLRAQHSFEWWEERHRESLGVPFLTHLRSFQSFHSNLSFQYSPMQSRSGLVEPQVSLRGGGGEMLRTTGRAETLARRFEETQGEMDETSWLIAQYVKGFQGGNESKAIISQYIRNVLNELPRSSLQERVNLLYFNTRNQAHFGHLRRSFTTNELPLHVLTNPFLMRASELLEPRARHEGRLISDLFRALGHKDMMSVPFESPFKPQWHHMQQVDLQDAGWESDFDRILDKVGPARVSSMWKLSSQDRLSPSELGQAVENFVIVGLNVLMDIDKDNRSLHDELRRITINRVKLKKVAIGPILAKVASALDVFFPAEQSGACIVLETERNVHDPLLDAGDLAVSRPSVSIAFGTRGMTHGPVATITGARLHVAAAFHGRTPDDLEYAFYLKENGVKVDESWYSPRPEAEFDVSRLKGALTIESFVRLKNVQGVPMRASVGVAYSEDG